LLIYWKLIFAICNKQIDYYVSDAAFNRAV